MPRSSAFKPVLLFLYPLIRQSLIKYHFEMDSIEYRADDVRSNELETGLSSSAETLSKIIDTAVSQLPLSSSSHPLHALFEFCSLKESHLKGFRKMFQFPKVPLLDYLAWVRKLAILPTGRYAFTRLTCCVAFIFPSIHLLCNC